MPMTSFSVTHNNGPVYICIINITHGGGGNQDLLMHKMTDLNHIKKGMFEIIHEC